ncbi:DUF916 domain-containing protein (plasmid) [Pontibacillus sp. ALD_SL1]|uniref:WxL protein peptidoglycan domain-containing protein n=1 Tax=Pontibacillus sp. ALD_SL1 TaxID=2777185 RepID=UPI001A96CB68|nr:DUF916 domain-containing protein [Pontibacillus sp. ALD_SL1]QST02784.1 DUF916 domain-containing protein [Pontibacillus sp. ALD_SL1]
MKKWIGIFLFLLCIPKFVHAEEQPSFSAIPVLTEDQKKGVSGYFSLRAEHGETMDLTVELRNNTNAPIVIKMDGTNGLTTKNGGIQYTVEDETEFTGFWDDRYKMKERIKIQKEITLGVNETKKIPVTVTVPEEGDGTFVGGLLFRPQFEEEKASVEEGDVRFEIESTFAYAMAIVLHVNDQEPNVKAEDAYTSYAGKDMNLLINWKNLSPTISRITNVQYNVMDDKDSVVFETNVKQIKMAPSTWIQYPLFWNGDVKAGEYQLHLTYELEGESHERKIPFTIGEKKVNQYIEDNQNRTDPVVVKNKTPFGIWVILFVLLAALVWILYKNKKKTKQ